MVIMCVVGYCLGARRRHREQFLNVAFIRVCELSWRPGDIFYWKGNGIVPQVTENNVHMMDLSKGEMPAFFARCVKLSVRLR